MMVVPRDKAVIRLNGLYAAAPGSTILGIAGLRRASGSRQTSITTMLVFELSVRPLGLCNPFPFLPCALKTDHSEELRRFSSTRRVRSSSSVSNFSSGKAV